MAGAGEAAAASSEKDTNPAPWEFRISPFGWAPTNINFHVKDGAVNEHLNISLDDIANTVKGILEIRGEVRKGRVGSFVSFMYIELNGRTGNQISIDVDDSVYYWNYGVTYEVGRWKLGDTSDAPVVTVEPFVGGSTLRDSIVINTLGREADVELEFTTPVAGVNTYVDIDEHWNFIFMANYGGFDVDDVHRTWNVVGGVGYRFNIGRHPANFQVGYRALEIDYRANGADLDITAAGPVVGLSFDF
jgi:hypothetical protein